MACSLHGLPLFYFLLLVLRALDFLSICWALSGCTLVALLLYFHTQKKKNLEVVLLSRNLGQAGIRNFPCDITKFNLKVSDIKSKLESPDVAV